MKRTTKTAALFNPLPLLLYSSAALFTVAWSQPHGSMCANNSSGTPSNASLDYAQCLDYEPENATCPYPELCETVSSSENVGLAFGLTIAAGLATTLGALLPFIPCIKRSNTLYLAGGLGLAAGVMLYVSFTEIWEESKNNFCCVTQTHFDLAATVCFFGGIALTVLLDLLVAALQRLDCGCCWRTCDKREKNRTKPENTRTTFGKRAKVAISPRAISQFHSLSTKTSLDLQLVEESSTDNSSGFHSTPTASTPEEGSEPDVSARQLDVIYECDNGSSSVVMEENLSTNYSHSQTTGDSDSRCHGNMPDNNSVSMVSNTISENTNNLTGVSVNELFSNSSLLRMNAIIPEVAPDQQASSHVRVVMGEGGEGCDGGEEVEVSKRGLVRRDSYKEMVEQKHSSHSDSSVEPEGPVEFREVTQVMGKDLKKLKRMGILTGLAVGIHNFPEGLATFVATLSSPSLGIALAVAIAMHNIPEGVCVAMPVYYATGSKWKAFLWAFLSGVSEPVGALLGWLVLKDVFGPLLYGISFGLIAGMMVFVSLKELLPTALKFDTRTDGVIVSVFLVIGMLIMAASLVLFLY